MIDKTVDSCAAAVADIPDGATVMIGGFGEAGSPIELIHALIDQGAKDLTVVNNNTGSGEVGLAALIKNERVAKMICSYPRTANSTVFPELYRAGKVELELVPQGTLAERIRAGGAGIPGFYTPTSYGTPLQEGKEVKEVGGVALVAGLGLLALGNPQWGAVFFLFQRHLLPRHPFTLCWRRPQRWDRQLCRRWSLSHRCSR